MYQQVSKLIKIFFITTLVINLSSYTITRADPPMPPPSTDIETPTLMSIFDPVARIINILVLSSGAALTIYIFYAAIKLSLALGDPKAFEGAKQTLTYAFMGFAIIIGFYVIFVVVVGLFGSTSVSTPMSIFEAIKAPIQTLVDLAGK